MGRLLFAVDSAVLAVMLSPRMCCRNYNQIRDIVTFEQAGLTMQIGRGLICQKNDRYCDPRVTVATYGHVSSV